MIRNVTRLFIEQFFLFPICLWIYGIIIMKNKLSLTYLISLIFYLSRSTEILIE